MSSARPKLRSIIATGSTSANTTTRAASTAFFPVQSAPSSNLPSVPKPHSSLWFTARPSLNSTITSLTTSLTESKSHLFRSGLLTSINSPLPISSTPGAASSSIFAHPRLRRWKNPKQMSTYLKNGSDLKSSQYKRLTSLLGNLEGLLPYAEVADRLPVMPGHSVPTLTTDPVDEAINGRSSGRTKADEGGSLKSQLQMILNQFQQPKPFSESGVEFDRIVGQDRRLGKRDPEGRIMAVGRRKESGARVWIIPTIAGDAGEDVPGRILINTLPLPAYFPLPSHRATVLAPLSLTASLGSFNVFAIAKGGGLNAQSDAVAMGISRALLEWERLEIEEGRSEAGSSEWRTVLKTAKLVERDPRMVERKKTGQLKARKMRAWVKR